MVGVLRHEERRFRAAVCSLHAVTSLDLAVCSLQLRVSASEGYLPSLATYLRVTCMAVNWEAVWRPAVFHAGASGYVPKGVGENENKSGPRR